MREIVVVLVAAFSALFGPTGARASFPPLASDVPVIEHAEIVLGPRGTKDRAFLIIWNGTSEEKIDHTPSDRRIRSNSARSGR
ncbi:hypothetical protein [Shinella sp.]|uniref:hypothetical protein n=1 Tax=Shinella sp. TaxID=1870904 RepID=UPI0028A2640D|nr:hypothetical protein [Shinella sp.]